MNEINATNETTDEINATREPKPGDVIWADRIVKGLPYNHCGIYAGGDKVIHFAAPEGSEISQENAVIHETTLDVFKDGCPLKIVDFPEGYSPEETLRRAKERVGERGYDFTINNCDHFATWCKTGEHRSLQVDEAKKAIKAVGGEVGEIICTIHDIAESFKAPRFEDVNRIQQPREILEGLDVNADMAALDPPVSDGLPPDEGESGETVEYEIIDDVDDVPRGELPEAAEASGGGMAGGGGVVEGGGGGGGAPVKKPWYERVGETLKKLTFPIAAALEYAKIILPVPPFVRRIPFTAIGAKVRNVIDNVVTGIKVFTGRLTPQQGREEMHNNETALLGSTVAQKQRQPVLQAVKQVFGKAGAFIKHAVQQVVTTIASPKVREAIKEGVQKVGHAIVSGVKAAAKAVGGFFAKIGSGIKNLFARRG